MDKKSSQLKILARMDILTYWLFRSDVLSGNEQPDYNGLMFSECLTCVLAGP